MRGVDDATWRPRILDAGSQAEEVRALADSPRVRVHDQLQRQLRDLVRARAPGDVLGDAEADERVDALLDGATPASHGRWVHYPWSGRLVHVLPPAEFRELRLDRNRPKITREEAARLGCLAVGVIGLSVGNAVALTLALEGSVGHLRLADLDHLDLSNLNRVRAGVHDLGLNKAVLAARQVFELDPYADVSVLPDGVTAANVDRFLDGDEALGPALDVLVDECDAVDVKVLAREHARRRRIPVLMETSDRGVVDVERFDLEPDRPLLHGLVDVSSSQLPEGGALDDAPTVSLRMVGATTMSTRMAAALVEVGSTLSTWPQLAGDVALGGATVTAAVRLLGTGRRVPSGRRYVDLDELLTRAEPGEVAPPADDAARPDPIPAPDTGRRVARGTVDETAIDVVRHAVTAPSGGNAQPWHFWVDDGRLWVTHETARSQTLYGASGHAAHLAIGAALENARIAAASRGIPTATTLFPRAGDATVVAALDWQARDVDATSELGALAPLVVRRQTDRRMAVQEPLPAADATALRDVAAAAGGHLQLTSDPDDIAEVAAIVGEVTRVRTLNPALHRELVGELRFTAEDAHRTRDGITVTSLGLPPIGEAAMDLLSRPDVARTLRAWDGGQRIAQVGAVPVLLSSAVGLLSAADDTPASWVEAGRALQRTWLQATAMGLALQPLGAVIFQLEVPHGPSSPLGPAEQQVMAELDGRLRRVFRRPGPDAMLFRLGRVAGEAERSLRLPAEWVTSLGAPPGAGRDGSGVEGHAREVGA